MAGGINEQTGIKVTGQEDKDFLDFISQEVKRYVDAAAQAGTLLPGQQPQGASPVGQQQPQAAQPWKTTINGQDFTFNTQEDLGKFLNDYHAYVQTQLAQAKQPVAPQEAKKPEMVRPSIDKDKFIQSFVDDPIGALADYQQKMEIAQYGAPVKDLLTGIAGTAENQRRALVAYQFRDSHPEFPNNDENAARTIASIVEQNRLPWTSEGLDMAYAFATSKGYIQPQQQQEQELHFNPGQQPQQPQAPPRFAPPQPGRGAAPVSDEKTRLVNFANLPLEKMREILIQMPPEAGR